MPVLHCPRCKILLNTVAVEDAGVRAEAWACNTCKGRFFEKGTLEEISKVVKVELTDFRAIPSERTQMTPLACPCCEGDDPMLKIVSDRDEHVTLDVCPSCRGTWVDKGELQAMQTETLFGFFKIIRRWFDPKKSSHE